MADQQRYYLPVVAQIIVLTVSGLVVLALENAGFIAWLSGGILAIVCDAWFTFRAIASKRVRSSLVVVANAQRGILEKYFLAASGFACIFVIIKPHTPLLVFLGFGLMTVTQLSVAMHAHRSR